MVERGARLGLEVTSLGSHGEGVGRVEGLAVFVPGALPGERVEVRVRERRERFARAELLAVERPSPDRRAPACAVAGRCGGCPLMALSPSAQRAAKRDRLIESLRRIGALQAPIVEDVLTAGDEAGLGYRAKTAMPVGPGPDGLVVGFYGRLSHTLVEAADCPVTDPRARAIAAGVRDGAAEVGMPPYDEASGQGLVRHIVVRVAHATAEALALVVTAAPADQAVRTLARTVRARLPALTLLAQSVQGARTNRILGDGPVRVLFGPPAIEERIGPLRLRLSPTAFFQVNPAVAEAMYARAVAELKLAGGECVVDAHCGVGAIGLWAAAAGAGRVVGFDTSAAAVEDARRNAALNGLRAQFACGPAETLYPRRFAGAGAPDAVVLDPPRAGAAPALLDALLAQPPARLVYVSCSPETLARDLGRLVRDGRFALERVVPVDLFPQTAHLEAIAVLRRGGASTQPMRA